MPTLYPPLYPERPDAPLLSYGRAFAEEIARSLLAVVWHGDEDGGGLDTDVQAAAALTMLEAFHPRDQLECMIAAQGVACHATIMDCFRRAMDPEAGFAETAKSRSNAAQLTRTFSMLLRDMERRQAKPLPPRPKPDGAPNGTPNGTPNGAPGGAPDGMPDGTPGGAPNGTRFGPDRPDAVPPRKSRAKKTPPSPAALPDDDDPGDLQSRPDGTPGSLAAYAPKPPPDEDQPPGEPAIMIALATRPKPWRQVNVPVDAPKAEVGPDGSEQNGPEPDGPEQSRPEPVGAPPDETAANIPAPRARGPGLLTTTERLFTGDALARFASARLDPDAPKPDFIFADEESVFELELLDTGPVPANGSTGLAAEWPEERPDSAPRDEHADDTPPPSEES